MPLTEEQIRSRAQALTAVLADTKDQQAVDTAFQTAKGDWPRAAEVLKDIVSEASLQKVAFAAAVAEIAQDDVPVVRAVVATDNVKSLRDVALTFNVARLADLVNAEQLAASADRVTGDEQRNGFATAMRRRLFDVEPTAVLQRMVQDEEIPMPDDPVRSGVIGFLNSQPDFNIRTTSVYVALTEPEAFKNIDPEVHAAVTVQLKTLQRVQAISPVPEAVPHLISANLTSAFRIAHVPESTFLRAHEQVLGADVARQVYTNAVNVQIRNENALMRMREHLRGAGLAIIDGSTPPEQRVEQLQAVADNNNVPLNLSDLFGGLDYCQCDDCLSVYSPASYFVELLEYLRSNNLDPTNSHSGKLGIDGTPLQMLLRRRPDLGCLELTCENTFTVLPYIDLVNEVMESFVVHTGSYHADTDDPKQATLDAFNVDGETTGELLAQPQHVNYAAYCHLKNAVYPFTLPYHQPIDASRIWLKAMNTSRYELLDVFRTATETCDTVTLTPDQQQQLRQLHGAVIDRAVDAEYLAISQEDYIILTGEAFWPKSYFELTTQTSLTDAVYRQEIGVRPVHEYYGYNNNEDLQSTDETAMTGLTFVKKQLLPRTGVHYPELVDLLKTRYINPAYPVGQARTLMEAVQFSYRFLQTLVDDTATDPTVRFAKLVDYLNVSVAPFVEASLGPDPCRAQAHETLAPSDLTSWVYCYFDRIGQLIVLDSGEEPTLPIHGTLFSSNQYHSDSLGVLHSDGTIVDMAGKRIGRVDEYGIALDLDGKPFTSKDSRNIRDDDGKTVGCIYYPDGSLHVNGIRVTWLPVLDTCDLTRVRLIHLDGSTVTVSEYDRIQRFIRLWRKMGWTIQETDEALVGLAAASSVPTPAPGGECGFVGLDTFQDDCGCGPGSPAAGPACPDIPPPLPDISTGLLHQLVAVRESLELSALPLDQLLTFWADIATTGDAPLYTQLFLSHNLQAIDPVFKSDPNGNVLTTAARLSEHVPVVTAALKLTADDITAIVADRQLPDALTLQVVSVLYRHGLLAKLLQVKVADLAAVFAVFGDPFTNAEATRRLLRDWQNMEDAGFTFRQLNYVVRDQDDPRRPLAPSQRTVVQTAKTLYDGLTGIDQAHPDLPALATDAATDDLVRAAAALLYDQESVERIVGLLDGTAVYSTNAPVGVTVTVPETLAKVFTYSQRSNTTPPTAAIQMTGILSDADTAVAKGLSARTDWAKAIDRLVQQPRRFFTGTLRGLFPDPAAAQQELLAADFNPAPDPTQPAAADPSTAPGKRLYFLAHFLPHLRERLAHKFVVDTMSTVSGLTSDVVDALLTTLLHVGTQPALRALENLKDAPAAGPADWTGYLIPPAGDSYTFVAVNSDTTPAPVLLGGVPIPFLYQQEDPSNVWWTDPVTLQAGTLRRLNTSGLALSQLQWKTPTSAAAAIPAAALLPDHASQATAEVFAKLAKAALLMNGFSLTAVEATHLQTHRDDFDGFDFNAPTVKHWRRLRDYCTLRDSLPTLDTTLLDLFDWAYQPPEHDDTSTLPGRLAAATLWNTDSITDLLSTAHFDLTSRTDFRNEVTLIKLQKAVTLAARTGASVDRLFSWANPTSRFSTCHNTAGEIQAALRARYDQTDWEQVVKPLYDQLREDQRSALIAYLLVQPDLIRWGVVDADSLFEFFLIDVQMGACLDTSRIKQAISTVQSYIQRCLLGLEASRGVAQDVLDRHRWDWMQNYRVWEANRKVFLYPENWLQAELRDDKSTFFTELESQLLQKDINSSTVQDALRAYVIKVNEVANLQVDGIFLDIPPATASTPTPTPRTLYVFARTRNAPHVFYHRYYTFADKNWYPWEKIDVDIPSYDAEATAEDGHVTKTENGAYLIPVLWNNRLLIFFPQFLRKTAARPVAGNKTFQQIGNGKVSDQQPLTYWEIRLGWSEYRNGKWAQKQLAPTALFDLISPSSGKPPAGLPPLDTYEFVPRIVTTAGDEKIMIDAYRGVRDRQPPAVVTVGGFQFSGSQLLATDALVVAEPTDFNYLDFHYWKRFELHSELHSLQGQDTAAPLYAAAPPYFDVPDTTVTFKPTIGPEVAFYHRFAHDLLGALNSDTLDGLFDYYLNNISSVPDKTDAYGGIQDDVGDIVSYDELKMPYALYNWEAAFHAPMLLADRLLAAGQFDAALAMLHRVLDPFASGTTAASGTMADPVWRFTPFRDTNAQNDVGAMFLSLQPNTTDFGVTRWREHPFQPHVIARDRPAAYMRWVAMKYIQTWIDYGDYYFRQNTLETIPMAIQCYVVAAHAYGPSGELIPKRGRQVPQTFNSLLDKWDAFGDALVELELAFPFSNQTPLPAGTSNGTVGLANIFGFATDPYFCIPDNPQLKALRALIDDRLFKIRHCQNIQGVATQYPLFEPPIDASLLVQAAAQGLSLASVLTDLDTTLPNYRFTYQLQKAVELCGELRSLGAGFLAAKEKGDAEALAQLRATHESSINNLVLTVRTQQLDEATKALDALQQSRLAPVYRLQHQLKLIGEDLAKVPQSDADFTELPDQIEQPVNDSGLKLITFEKEEMDKAAEAQEWQTAVGVVETLASVFHVIPTATVNGTPIGVGGTVVWGGGNLGNASQAVARGIQVHASSVSFEATSAGRKAGFLRQLQDRVLQANIAGYEIKNIDRQVLTQQIRIALAQQEITNQQKQIDNSQEIQDFLRSKYSNTDLYAWLDTQTRGLYYQAYTMAYDLAKKAEKLFRFERGLTNSDFIQFGYWDGGRDGLLAGERLFNGLKQLEAAYQETRGHDFEITKAISLRQLNPAALVTLRETGTCEFAVPEVLFDMDYPGHYARRIKTVSLLVPAVVGPYTGLNCTLRLLEHKYRNTPLAPNAADYPETTDDTDDRFTTGNVPITSIAVSALDNESGVFELNFRDERYLPFEYAGAVSKWRVELPDQFRQFDYDTMTDVVLRLKYTAMDGGDKLKAVAADTVQRYIRSVENLSRDEGLFAAYDVVHDFPDQWYAATHPAAGATDRVLTVDRLYDLLPVFTKGRPPAKIQATDLYLYASAPTLTAATLTATQGGNNIAFTDGPAVGGLKVFVAHDVASAMDTLQLTIADTATQIDQLWLLERYTLL